MKSLLSVVFCLLLLVDTKYSQKLDSMKSSLVALEGVVYARVARNIGTIYLKENQYDSADKYYDFAIEAALRISEHELAGKSLNNKGVSNYKRGRFKEAINFYQNAIYHYEQAGNDTLVAKGRTNLGLTFKGLNLYQKSLDNLYSGAKVLEKLNFKKELSSGWNAIGNIHRELGNSELSLEYLTQAMNIRRELQYQQGVAQSMHNIGIWHLEEDQVFTALNYFKTSLIIKKTLGNKKATATTLAKIGETYVKLDSLIEAEKYYVEALSLREVAEDNFGIAVSSNHLGDFYLKTGRTELAQKFLGMALKYGEQSNYLRELARTYESFKKYNKLKQNYSKALMYADLLAYVNQQILDEEKAKSLIESEIRYEVFRKDQEIAENRNQVKLLKERTIWLIVIVMFLTVLILVFVRLYVLSQRLSSTRRLSKEKVEGLLKELHHRTKNHLQAQSSLIKLQSSYLKDTYAKDIMTDVGNRMKAVTLIHQSLFYSSDFNVSENISLADYLKNLTENLMISFKYDHRRIDVVYNLQSVNVDVFSAVPIGLFVNEAITNTFKHAFQGTSSPELSVELLEENSSILVRVSDNGKGLGKRVSDSNSFGLTTMNDLATQLKGKFIVEGKKGTIVELRIPNSLKKPPEN